MAVYRDSILHSLEKWWYTATAFCTRWKKWWYTAPSIYGEYTLCFNE
jgi:hypothetical protein